MVVLAPLYMFGTLGTRSGRARLCVGLCEARVRGIGGACGDPAYVFAAFFTMPGHSRLRVGLCEACVRAVGARVGTLVVLLHDLRACHSAYASGLVSQGGGKRRPRTLAFRRQIATSLRTPGQLCLWSSVWVLFAYYLPTPPL